MTKDTALSTPNRREEDPYQDCSWGHMTSGQVHSGPMPGWEKHHETKEASMTTPSPISHERAFHIALVLEMSELSDRNSPEDDPSAMVTDSNEMAGCIERALERADLVLVPPVSEPVAWWNGFRKDDDERDGLSGPTFSPVETTWHDIPLYAGVNPCNLSTAPTTGSAPEAWIKMRKSNGETELCSEGPVKHLALFDWEPLYTHPASPEASASEPVSELESTEDYLVRRDRPAASVLTDELRIAVLSALDDLKLIVLGEMGTSNLDSTFIALVEALEPERAVDSDWRCRRNNAFDRFALLAASMGGEKS